MTEITTNLEVAKQEPATPPSTPEKASNIKERLNLHVKRRLQQDALPIKEDLQQNHKTIISNNEIESVKNRKSEKTKQTKVRKPYQKRVAKSANESVSIRKSDTINGVQSKNSVLSSAGGNGDDDGSHDGNEAEGKCASSREREKCPDVLAMVLSAKKRALMQNPDVQDFLFKVMDAIKT